MPFLLPLIPAAVSAVSAVGASAAAAAGTAAVVGGAAATAGTFLGLSATAWTGIGLAAGLAGTAMQAIGQHQQGKQQEQANKYNAQVQDIQALDAERRGSIAEGRQRQRAKLITGAINAQQGGSGVVAGQDTGGDILAESAEYGARDAAALRLNAGREAWGMRSQAVMDRYGGQVAAGAGNARASSTFLQGANTFAANPWWKQWSTPKEPFAGQTADVSWSGY